MNLLGQNKVLALLILCVSFYGCEKSEGPGGTSTIRGKVITQNWDPSYQILGETYPQPDQKVYIIYGNEKTTYDDDFDTSFDGSYEFKYLQEGTYKIFVYSKDSTGAGVPPNIPSEHDKVVITTVEVKDNGETVEVPDLIILENEFQ